MVREKQSECLDKFIMEYNINYQAGAGQSPQLGKPQDSTNRFEKLKSIGQLLETAINDVNVNKRKALKKTSLTLLGGQSDATDHMVATYKENAILLPAIVAIVRNSCRIPSMSLRMASSCPTLDVDSRLCPSEVGSTYCKSVVDEQILLHFLDPSTHSRSNTDAHAVESPVSCDNEGEQPSHLVPS